MSQDFLQCQYMTAVHHEVTRKRVPADVRQLAFRQCDAGSLKRRSKGAIARLERQLFDQFLV